MIIVTSYENSDSDGCGGAIGYAELLRAQGKDAEARMPGVPALEAQYVFSQLKDTKLVPFSATLDDDIVEVDASESQYLTFLPSFDKVIEIIDHRKNNDAETFKNAKVQIELVGAAATLVAERFVQAGVTPSHDAALFLYAGIISNTLNFLSTNYTERDTKMVEWLKGICNPPTDFVHNMFAAKSDLAGEKLGNEMDIEMAFYDFKGLKLAFTQLEVVDGQKLVTERLNEIKSELLSLKKRDNFDLIFLSVNDLEDDSNYFVTSDSELEEALEKILEVKFENDVARRIGHIMRKQIVPPLRDYFEAEQDKKAKKI